MIFTVLFSFLVATYNFIVIKSYKGYDKHLKDLWHNIQALMVILVLMRVTLDLKLFISYGLAYYVVFESTLNLWREKHIFYVSKDGSWSDKVRSKLYGKHPQIIEGIIKTILIFISYKLWHKF